MQTSYAQYTYAYKYNHNYMRLCIGHIQFESYIKKKKRKKEVFIGVDATHAAVEYCLLSPSLRMNIVLVDIFLYVIRARSLLLLCIESLWFFSLMTMCNHRISFGIFCCFVVVGQTNGLRHIVGFSKFGKHFTWTISDSTAAAIRCRSRN